MPLLPPSAMKKFARRSPLLQDVRGGDLHSPKQDRSAPLKRGSVHARLQGLDPLDDSFTTQVIQTVSLIQYVDREGNPLQIQTLYPPPATFVLDAQGNTLDTSLLDLPVTLDVPEPTSSGADQLLSDPLAGLEGLTGLTVSDSTSLSTESLAPPRSSQSSNTTSSSPSTTTTTLAPSFAASFNQTSNHGSWNSSFVKNNSLLRPLRTSTSTRSSSTNTLTSSSTGATLGLLATGVPNDVGSGGSGGGGGDGNFDSSGIPPPHADSNGAGAPPPTATVVGSVVGGIAGVALIVLLVFVALKWNRKRNGQIRLDDESSNTRARGFLTDGGAGGGSGGGGGQDGAMVQRALTMTVPAVLASMSKFRTPEPNPIAAPLEQSEESGERGFYRVSGRRLPSVLEHGGDGYSDPRQSKMSMATLRFFEPEAHNQPLPAGPAAGRSPPRDEPVNRRPESQPFHHSNSMRDSDTFRESQIFPQPEPPSLTPDGTPRLALGSPMRPASGVMIMRNGPARTPVTEQTNNNPFNDPPTPPRVSTVPDAIGRSLTGQDGSGTSGTKFTEMV